MDSSTTSTSLQNTAKVVEQVKEAADLVLATIQKAAPSVAQEAGCASTIVDLVAVMVGTALTAYSAAAGVPITAESILALLPNSVALTPPGE